MKKFIIFLLIFCIMQELSLPAISAVWRGHAEYTDVNDKPQKEKIFTGKVDKIEEKEVIKMVVSQVLQGGTTTEGDEFLLKFRVM